MPVRAAHAAGPVRARRIRHMALFGTTSEQLAQIAVSTREWATLNPRARYRDPITIEDVLSSPMQSTPLHRLDCCLVTDGAGAFVLTSADRARSLPKPPVFVLGAATCHDHSMISQMPDLTVTPGAVSGPAAFHMAGLKPSDVDVLMGYDSFTITALLHLEDLGFCPKGEGGPFVGRRQARARRRAADQHQRRWPVLHASRHVRHVPDCRGGAPAPRRVRRHDRSPAHLSPSRTARAGALVHVDARSRHGGRALSAEADPAGAAGVDGDPAVLGRHP